MTKHDTRYFHEILATEAAGLRRKVRNRDEIKIEAAPEEYERVSLAGQRELALVLVDHESRRLRAVEVALLRLEQGIYGTCLDCEEPISAKRLKAIPWASRCVGCQEAADHEQERTEPCIDVFAA